ncbi:glycosyltransferase family 4 protein, partial [Selenomonas ruminantium]|uniref:glycosyltransferase family 4 protein n=1 Tax=Selenomonas ruminantium TaxID=971 RepID=UPI0026EEE8AE
MKVAIVHDWFVVYAGAERVVEQLLELYPEADLFSTVDFLPDGKRDFIKNKKVHTTFIQHLPGARKHYRSYLPLMPLAIEQLDLSGYDLIISSSSCVAKGVITGPDQIHICMCYTPVRYAWDLQHQYLQEAGMTKGLKSWLARIILHYIRMWDLRTVNNVDHFIAISKYIERRIKKYYRRESTVIYPPVDVDKFELCEEKEDYYLTASRMVPYKKIKLLVEAFNEMPDKKLVVIGDGPEFARTKAIAKENITMMGYQPYEVLKEKMQHAKAFVFAAEEDFGITPIEAQACGTPVIAYGKGGVLETVKDNETGMFFLEQNVESIIEVIDEFERNKDITLKLCRENAEKFSIDSFRNTLKIYIQA